MSKNEPLSLQAFLIKLLKISDKGSLWLDESGISIRLGIPINLASRYLNQLLESGIVSYELEHRSYMNPVKLVINEEVYKSLSQSFRQVKRNRAKLVKQERYKHQQELI